MSSRVLVVDDSPTQLEALRDVLARAGFDVRTAQQGVAALETLRAGGIDLVVSDVMMPGMTGYELCRRIKDEYGADDAPPVILLTSLSDPRDIVRGLESGADGYVTKPYEPEQLISRVARVLESRELRDRRSDDEGVAVRFMGDMYTVRSDPPRILELLLSTFEDLIRSNNALEASQRALNELHARELQREQDARVRAEQDRRRLEELKRRAEAATRARDEVLAAVSHDLRNPLGTIHTSAALLLEIELPDDARRRQLEIIRRTTERMNRLIQDLLDVARLESGFFAIEPGVERVGSLFAEIAEQFGPLAEEKQVRFEQRIADPEQCVRIDRGRIVQVASNLIGNALKFTPQGGRIMITAVATDDGVRCSVADSGPGIAREDLPRIFERFWQGGGAAAGAGLGLAIAKGIVEAHGGRIWAESSDTGATFHFTLPPAESEADAS
jgi:two-component system, sensor histidine kinase and response regulator